MTKLEQTLQESFLSYVNDFLTVNKFAEHYNLQLKEAYQIIEIGKRIHEDKVERINACKKDSHLGVYPSPDEWDCWHNGRFFMKDLVK
jgi:hypothetical protein